MKNIQPGQTPSLWILPFIFVLIFVAYAIIFYIVKLTIESIFYKDKSIEFKGSFGNFLGTLFLGIFLTIITLGVYAAWFIRDIHRFFIDNSSYNSNSMKFKGKGGKLFVIILLTIMVPIIVFSIVIAKYMLSNPSQISSMVIIQQIVMNLILIPYMYLVYKWMINIDYKEFNITWKTDFWSSCSKILMEMILTIITIGIYGPLAMLRLYKYFTDRTIAESSERKLEFGFDMDQLNDFLFIWGQTLLTIITLGIYYPWAICKIGNRILSKTYLQED
jgi:uncharacterized membrane protein YjgN (DUF898 family)